MGLLASEKDNYDTVVLPFDMPFFASYIHRIGKSQSNDSLGSSLQQTFDC